MRVFVTGGSGYLGREVIAALGRHGHQVGALTRSDAAARVVRAAGAVPIPGQLTDPAVLRAAAADADAAIHLAQVLDADGPAIDRAAAEAMQAGLGGRGAYVHTGGTWVYGSTDGVVDENAPKSPPALVAWREENEKRVLDRPGRPVLVMPGIVYGGGSGLLPAFFRAPDGSARRIGSGDNHWSVVHVADVAELYALALHAPAGAVYAGVIDIHPTQAEMVSALAAGKGPVTEIPYRDALERMGPIAEAFALDQRITGARARRELGWAPKHLDPTAEL